LTTPAAYHTTDPNEPAAVLTVRAKLARVQWLLAATDGSERIEQRVARDRLLRAERALRALS
jgi:hypothetical protein